MKLMTLYECFKNIKKKKYQKTQRKYFFAPITMLAETEFLQL